MEPAERVMTPTQFLNIPVEVQRKMLLYLDLNSILNVCAASKGLRTWCDSEFFWEQKTKMDFPEVFDLVVKNTWQEEYKVLWIETAIRERRIAEILDLPPNERFQLLLDIDYYELWELCEFARGRIVECDDDDFWLEKFKHDFGTNHAKIADTWKEEYEIRYAERITGRRI